MRPLMPTINTFTKSKPMQTSSLVKKWIRSTASTVLKRDMVRQIAQQAKLRRFLGESPSDLLDSQSSLYGLVLKRNHAKLLFHGSWKV